jgi:hypothetical protein
MLQERTTAMSLTSVNPTPAELADMKQDFELFADNDSLTDFASIVVPLLSVSPESGNPDSMPHYGPSRMPERE